MGRAATRRTFRGLPARAPRLSCPRRGTPGISGLNLQVRPARDQYPADPLYLRARASVLAAVRAIRDGAVDFLIKPLNNQDPLDCIDECIGESVRRGKDPQAARRWRAGSRRREREALDGVVAGETNCAITAGTKMSVKTITRTAPRSRTECRHARSPRSCAALVELRTRARIVTNYSAASLRPRLLPTGRVIFDQGPASPRFRAHARFPSDDRLCHLPSHPVAEVARPPAGAAVPTVFTNSPAPDALGLHHIRTVFALYLAGRAVPPALFEYAVEEVCRLIDEALLASSSSDSRWKKGEPP